LTVVGLPIDHEGLLPEPFTRACRQGGRVLYCTPTVQNPTSALMSAARREEIGAIARQFDVTVIEDDVYGMLPRHAPPALSSVAPDQCIFVSSLSKTVAPGLRIAFVVAPTERAAKQFAAGVRATTWMATPLTAEIASSWIRDGVAMRLLNAYRAEANARQALAARYLAACDWHAHADGYHGWLQLPDGWTTAEFMMQARRQGVVVSPSDVFAVGADPVPAAVRLSLCAAPAVADLERALERIARVLETGPEVGLAVL
jgi:DNA-binding transcriptional MocR family regulator